MPVLDAHRPAIVGKLQTLLDLLTDAPPHRGRHRGQGALHREHIAANRAEPLTLVTALNPRIAL